MTRAGYDIRIATSDSRCGGCGGNIADGAPYGYDAIAMQICEGCIEVFEEWFMTVSYRFISDSGHGWMEVPTVDVAKAGFVPSAYSYHDPETGKTYLEEDCDMAGYLKASSIKDSELKLVEVYYDGDAWIRELPRC